MPRQILLVDDSATIARMVQHTFAHEDYAVTVAKSGDEAIARARSAKPDVVLVDAGLAGKSGYDVCADLRAAGGEASRSAVVAACLVLGLIAAVTAVLWLYAPRYTASAALVLDVKSPDPIVGSTMPGATMPTYMATQVDVLYSERVALRVIDALGLDRDPEFREDWNEETDGRGDFRSWLAERITRKLDARPGRESNVIGVKYTAVDAQRSAAIANACSSPSTEHGPAMIASWRLPIAQRPTLMTVSCGWKIRLTSLNGTGMVRISSTPSQARTAFQSTSRSPTAPSRT